MTRDAPAVYAVLAFIAGLVAAVSPLLNLLALFIPLPFNEMWLVWSFLGGLFFWPLFSWLDAMKGPHG